MHSEHRKCGDSAESKRQADVIGVSLFLLVNLETAVPHDTIRRKGEDTVDGFWTRHHCVTNCNLAESRRKIWNWGQVHFLSADAGIDNMVRSFRIARLIYSNAHKANSIHVRVSDVCDRISHFDV